MSDHTVNPQMLNPSAAATSQHSIAGFAIADVNYGGSTGYGRQYRNRLRRNWGIVDVADCSNAAKHLAKQGKADEKRLCIDGGSAGGYTTLACLAFRWGLLWQQDDQLGELFPGFDWLTAHVKLTKPSITPATPFCAEW